LLPTRISPSPRRLSFCETPDSSFVFESSFESDRNRPGEDDLEKNESSELESDLGSDARELSEGDSGRCGPARVRKEKILSSSPLFEELREEVATRPPSPILHSDEESFSGLTLNPQSDSSMVPLQVAFSPTLSPRAQTDDERRHNSSSKPEKGSGVRRRSLSKSCPPSPKRIRLGVPELEKTALLLFFFQPGIEQAALSDLRFDSFSQQYILGQGSFGTVWAAKHKATRKPYALKKSKDRIGNLAEKREMIESLGNLEKLLLKRGEWHPHILRHFAVWQEARHLHVLTEICELGDAEQVWDGKAQVEALSEVDVWRLIVQIFPH